MRFKDLLNKYTDKQILNFMKVKDKKNLPGYKKMLVELRKIKAKRCNTKIVLHGSWDDVTPARYVDVSGEKNGEYLAIEFVPWDQWLGMQIDQGTLDHFDPEMILADCLHEMTWNGFKHGDTAIALDKIAEEIKAIDISKLKG